MTRRKHPRAPSRSSRVDPEVAEEGQIADHCECIPKLMDRGNQFLERPRRVREWDSFISSQRDRTVPHSPEINAARTSGTRGSSGASGSSGMGVRTNVGVSSASSVGPVGRAANASISGVGSGSEMPVPGESNVDPDRCHPVIGAGVPAGSGISAPSSSNGRIGGLRLRATTGERSVQRRVWLERHEGWGGSARRCRLRRRPGRLRNDLVGRPERVVKLDGRRRAHRPDDRRVPACPFRDPGDIVQTAPHVPAASSRCRIHPRRSGVRDFVSSCAARSSCPARA